MSARDADMMAASAANALNLAADTMGARWVVDWFFAWLVGRYPKLRDWKLSIRILFWSKSWTLDDIRDALIAALAALGIE